MQPWYGTLLTPSGAGYETPAGVDLQQFFYLILHRDTCNLSADECISTDPRVWAVISELVKRAREMKGEGALTEGQIMGRRVKGLTERQIARLREDVLTQDVVTSGFETVLGRKVEWEYCFSLKLEDYSDNPSPYLLKRGLRMALPGGAAAAGPPVEGGLTERTEESGGGGGKKQGEKMPVKDPEPLPWKGQGAQPVAQSSSPPIAEGETASFLQRSLKLPGEPFKEEDKETGLGMMGRDFEDPWADPREVVFFRVLPS